MFEFLENILYEFKNIPGLSFLKRLHTDLTLKRSRVRSKMQTLRNHKSQVMALKAKAGKAGTSAKGSKQRSD